MKNLKWVLMCLIFSLSMTGPVMAQDSLTDSEQNDPIKNTGGVKSLEDRLEALEAAMNRKVPSDKWYDRIQLSGLIEVEAGYAKIDFNDPLIEAEKISDVDLANIELNVDAKIADHVDGHLKIKYEEDDLFIDEGFITLKGPENICAYLTAGRQYIPFGNYDSHFITDPNTLVLGETSEGAVLIGYCFGGEMLEISAGAFNGTAKKSGNDDAVDSFVAAVISQPFKGCHLGASYTSNLAGSNSFNEQVVDPDNLDALVGAWSAFISIELLNRFNLTGEYVGALDHFKAGEIYDAADTKQRKPAAWNAELGVTIVDDLSVALRYGGSDDGGDAFLPETQYGAVVNWGVFKNTNVGIEYLHDTFEDDYQDTDTGVIQLAIEY